MSSKKIVIGTDGVVLDGVLRVKAITASGHDIPDVSLDVPTATTEAERKSAITKFRERVETLRTGRPVMVCLCDAPHNREPHTGDEDAAPALHS